MELLIPLKINLRACRRKDLRHWTGARAPAPTATLPSTRGQVRMRQPA